MKTTGRLSALTLGLVLSVAACTGGGDGKDGGKTTGPTGQSGVSGPTGTISVPPGSNVYRYVNAGLVAILDLDTDTLEIQNRTGHELAKPAFYVLDARDGTEIDGQVQASAVVPDGQTETFDVTLSGIEPKNIGMAILLMGKDNYGGFVRQ
jgi:hypothetical protein